MTVENFFDKLCNEIGFGAYNMQKEKFTQRRLIKMATREENLKKINDELEKLSDDELEKVAGGSIHFRPRRPRSRFAIGEDKPNQRPDSATVDMETGRL